MNENVFKQETSTVSHLNSSMYADRSVASYRFTGEAARLIGQSALEDLVDPGRSGRGIAVVILGVQRAVGKAAIGLVLLPLFLKQIRDGVEQVVQELMGILLHVVIKQL